MIRQIGSAIFIASLFTVIFTCEPWHVLTATDPAVPWSLRIAIFGFLRGVLIVLVSLAFEQRGGGASTRNLLDDQSDREVLLLNTEELKGSEIAEFLGIVQGHTVFEIWLGKDLSASRHGNSAALNCCRLCGRLEMFKMKGAG